MVGLITQATLQHFLYLQHTSALSAIPDYLFRVDIHGVYREVVTYKPEITLFPENLDPVGLSMIDVLPEEIATQQLFYLAETFRTDQLKVYEQQIRINNRLRDEEVRVMRCGDDEALFMIRDITDRKQTERQIQSLIEGTAATMGQDFFPALVRHIAAALDVAYVAVCELVDDNIHTLAFWANGRLHPSMTYHVMKTPCEWVIRDGRFYCPRSVQQHFPEDLYLVEMQAESYLGIALYDTQGNAIGELCILDLQPIQAPQRAEKILQAFAARAAAELERQRTQVVLEELNQALETKVTERTAALQEREQFLQTVLDTFPISVFWKDLNSVYVGCNRNFLKDAGLTAMPEMVSKTDYDMPWGAGHAVHAQMDDRQVMQSNTAKLGIEET